MENNIDFISIEKKSEMIYLNNLIKACDKAGIDKSALEEKLEELSIKDKQENKQEVTNITESPTSQQYSDDYLYQKSWTKLTAIHKIIKVKEFVNMLLINDDTEKQLLKDKLVNMIKNKILTKKEAVMYDSVKGKIISIVELQYKNGKYII